jgi:hypothetical protein
MPRYVLLDIYEVELVLFCYGIQSKFLLIMLFLEVNGILLVVVFFSSNPWLRGLFHIILPFSLSHVTMKGFGFVKACILYQ